MWIRVPASFQISPFEVLRRCPLLTSGTGSLNTGTDPNLLAGTAGVDVGETLMLAA
jgi:hypothetical protein